HRLALQATELVQRSYSRYDELQSNDTIASGWSLVGVFDRLWLGPARICRHRVGDGFRRITPDSRTRVTICEASCSSAVARNDSTDPRLPPPAGIPEPMKFCEHLRVFHRHVNGLT